MSPRSDSAGTDWGGESNGTKYGPGGKNGGQSFGPGGKNGGQTSGPGSGGNGTKITNNGGARGGATQNGNGGEMARADDHQQWRTSTQCRAEWRCEFPACSTVQQLYDFNGPLPTVRTFSRYLVILGVVFSTVFVTMAAWSMVFGNQYGAARVLGAVGGLLMLLAGYTIYKIVQLNTMHANSSSYESHYQRRRAAA